MNALQRADAELAEARGHARALRASLANTSPWLWLPAGAVAGALAARLLPVTRTRGAPVAAAAGLIEGWLLAGVQALIARHQPEEEEAP